MKHFVLHTYMDMYNYLEFLMYLLATDLNNKYLY